MARGLTRRQELILQFLIDYIQKEGYPPSIREIGQHFQIGSLRGVTVHLDALEKKGYIERANLPRSIRVIHPAFQSSQKVSMLPLVGASSPAMIRSSVLLPLPLGPSNAKNCPAGMDSDTSSIATTSPSKTLRTWRSLTAGGAVDRAEW